MVRAHCGRLLIPAWMSSGINAHKPAVLIALYSDDRGDSWELGEILESCETLPDPTECSIAQLDDGTVLATIRHNNRRHYRGFAYGKDEGRRWLPPWLNQNAARSNLFGRALHRPRGGTYGAAGADKLCFF